jgi:hypothetical protein
VNLVCFVACPATLDAASTDRHDQKENIVAAKDTTPLALQNASDALDMFAYDDPFTAAQTNHLLYASICQLGLNLCMLNRKVSIIFRCVIAISRSVY